MVFGGLCWIRGRGSPGSGAYLRGISGSFLATGIASAAIMMDSLVKGIGPAVGGGAPVPGSAAHPAAAYPRQDSVDG